jgi:hypothetical protein
MFYHQPEGDSVSKTLRLHFSFEAFYYLSWKVQHSNDVFTYSFERKQRIIIYYDDVSMKNISKQNRVNIIQFLNKSSLAVLQELLGYCVGIGLGKQRPTKAKP